MLHRLVVRLLDKPGLRHNADFMDKMNAVRKEIQSEVAAGRDDSWALADLSLVNFLCGGSADSAVDFLERSNAEPSFYESTYNAVAALVNEGLGKGHELGTQLDDFMRLSEAEGRHPIAALK